MKKKVLIIAAINQVAVCLSMPKPSKHYPSKGILWNLYPR